MPGHVLGFAEVARLALTRPPTVKTDAQFAQLAEGVGGSGYSLIRCLFVDTPLAS